MPWKKKDGQIVVGESGNPVYEYPSGDTVEYDADEQVKKIRELTTKSTKRKETISSLNATLDIIAKSGVDTSDPDAVAQFVTTAKDNSDKVANFNDSDLVKADDVKKIKEEVANDYERKLQNQKANYEGKLTDMGKTLEKKDRSIARSVIKSGFARSKFIKEKTSYPNSDIAFDHLNKKFTVEEIDGEHRGFGIDRDGNKLYSLKSPTEFAELDEAIELVISNHPQKEQLLLADAGGSGADSNSKKRRTVADVKTVQKGDSRAFGQNLEDIASGKVKVE